MCFILKIIVSNVYFHEKCFSQLVKTMYLKIWYYIFTHFVLSEPRDKVRVALMSVKPAGLSHWCVFKDLMIF